MLCLKCTVLNFQFDYMGGSRYIWHVHSEMLYPKLCHIFLAGLLFAVISPAYVPDSLLICQISQIVGGLNGKIIQPQGNQSVLDHTTPKQCSKLQQKTISKGNVVSLWGILKVSLMVFLSRNKYMFWKCQSNMCQIFLLLLESIGKKKHE